MTSSCNCTIGEQRRDCPQYNDDVRDDDNGDDEQEDDDNNNDNYTNDCDVKQSNHE